MNKWGENNKNPNVIRQLAERNFSRGIIIGCVILALALFILCLASLFIVNKVIVDKLKQNELQMQAESISTILETKMGKAISVARLIAYDSNSSSQLDMLNKAGYSSKAISYFEELNNIIPYDTVFWASLSNNQYWLYHNGKLIQSQAINSSEYQSRIESFLQEKVPYEIKIDYDETLQNDFVWVNALIKEDNSPEGVVGVGINIDTILQSLEEKDEKNGKHTDLWLVNGSGDIGLSKDREYQNGTLQQFFPPGLVRSIQAASDQHFSIQEYENEADQLYDIAYKRIPHSEWTIVIRTLRADNMAFLNDMKYYMGLAGIIILLCTGAVFYIVSKHFVDPYKRSLKLNYVLEQEVTKRTAELKKKSTRIQDSLEYARMIQQAILPSEEELLKYLHEAFVLFEPKESIGGDFYWYHHFESGMLLCVGDCTGHGVPGALMTTAVNAMLNHISEEADCTNPAFVLRQLSLAFSQTFSGNKSKSIEDGLEAAVVFVSYDGKLIFSGANMSIYYDDGDEIKEISGERGMIDSRTILKEKDFAQHVIEGKKMDMFYLITDGYYQQPGGERSLPYGKKRLLRFLHSIVSLPGLEQKEKIREEFHAYASLSNRRDDVTVLGFRI